ncbi:unnamed protein product, partial [Phaeothamnion confervicola]
PVFGDTGGAIIRLTDVVVSQGDTELIRDAEWDIMPGERTALVGQNGAGKSTLLSIIAGVKEADEGRALVKTGTRVGYLVQTAVAGSTCTVYEEACSQMDRIREAGVALAAAERRMGAAPEDAAALDALLAAQTTFEAVGGLTQEKTVSQVLAGLGFSHADQQRRCSEFSGGWQMRIALARLLLSDADLLLLDEPTNHLDSSAKAWLGKYLSGYRGTVLTVSHDESLLDALQLTGIAEVREQRLDVFRGCDHARYLTERVERVRLARARFEREQAEMARLQGFVDRFGAKASKASAAQSRVKKLEKMEAVAADAPPPEELRSFRA